jgi:hypothetical protein
VFTTDVAGAALAASLLCRDWKSEMLERKPVFGIPEGPYLERASEEGLTHFRALCRRLREAEYLIIPVNAMPDFSAIRERHMLSPPPKPPASTPSGFRASTNSIIRKRLN